MLAFNRAFIEIGAHVRGLECTDDVLRLLWSHWTNNHDGGAGWWEFGAEVLIRTRISTAKLKSDEPPSVHASDLLFRHDYGIDIVMRCEDAPPAYGGWIYASGVKLSGRIVNGYHALIAEGGGLDVAYTFDPSPEIRAYRPENRSFDFSPFRRVLTQRRPKGGLSRARHKK